MTPEENEGFRKVPHFSQKIMDDNVMKNDVLQQKSERICVFFTVPSGLVHEISKTGSEEGDRCRM